MKSFTSTLQPFVFGDGATSSQSRKRPSCGATHGATGLFRAKPRMWVPRSEKPPLVSDEDDLINYDSDSSSWSDDDDLSEYDYPYDGDEDLARPPKRSRKDLRRVRFSTSITVHKIPSHTYYTAEEKKRLWHSKSTLKKLIRRNRKEFAWESSHREVDQEDAFWVNQEGRKQHLAHRPTVES